MAQSDGRTTHTLTFASSATSSAATLGSESVLGLMLPATGSGDFAATTVYLLFEVSMDGTTYELLEDVDSAVKYVTVAEDNTCGAVPLDPTDFAAWRFVRLKAYATDKTTAVVQAAVTVTLISGTVVG